MIKISFFNNIDFNKRDYYENWNQFIENTNCLLTYSKEDNRYLKNIDLIKKSDYENWKQHNENSNANFAYSNYNAHFWKILILIKMIIMRTEISSLKIRRAMSHLRKTTISFDNDNDLNKMIILELKSANWKLEYQTCIFKLWLSIFEDYWF
jgi:hypothetical protein